MIIPAYINTQTYNLKNSLYISIIENIKNGNNFVLKGISSVLWTFIVNNKSYEYILNFAIENKLEKELYGLFYELKINNLINTKKEFPSLKTNYLKVINKNNKNFNYFKTYINKFFHNYKLIYILSLDLNYGCNLKCKHCFTPKNMNEYQISYNQAKKIIDEACEIGVYCILIGGGECTINPDFLKISRYIREKHMSLYIKTNGIKLYDDIEFFNELIKIYPSSIDISLYSMNPQIHDYITGVKGSHLKSLEVIKKLKEKKINVSIMHQILAYNKNEYIDVEKFAKSNGINYIIDNKFIYNPDNNNKSARLNGKDLENYYINNIDINNIRPRFYKDNQIICTAGLDKISISPKLDIFPCHNFYYKLGNYKNISLKQFKEEIYPKFIKTFIRSNLKECFKFDYCDFCDYCPQHTLYTFMKKSRILCEDAKAYKNAYLKLKQLQNKTLGYIINS